MNDINEMEKWLKREYPELDKRLINQFERIKKRIINQMKMDKIKQQSNRIQPLLIRIMKTILIHLQKELRGVDNEI